MKRLVIITAVIVILVGACTAILVYNKKRIDEKSKLNGNLDQIPVFVTEVKKSTLAGDFEVNGSFSAIHELTLLSEGQGKVTRLMFSTGEVVQSGQVLATLDSDLISSQLAFAEAAFDKAKADMKKYEGLLRAGGVSNQQVEDAKLAMLKSQTDVATLRKQLDFSTIKAPIQGTVTKRLVEQGSLVMPGTPVAEIVDVSRLKMVANMAETEVVHIHKGMKVEITSSLFPGVNYSGTVVSVGVKADEARRFPVEIELVNDPSNPLKAGMFGTVAFGFEGKREAITIPRNALVGSIKTPKVYVVENGKALLKDVVIGTSMEKEVEIVKGLAVGDMIVTAGQINLDNKVSVKIIANK